MSGVASGHDHDHQPRRQPGPDAPRPTVRRLDEVLGLAVLRAGLSPVTLVTYARDHVAVRTPSRSGFLPGNALDLTSVPQATDLEGYVGRFEGTVGSLGARQVQLRWETSLPADAPPTEPAPDPDLVAAASRLGLAVTATTVLLGGAPAGAPAPAGVELVPVLAPQAPDDGLDARRWYATGVLHRYRVGGTPDEWRDHDRDAVAWRIEQELALAHAGRAQLWVALRHAMPVARVTVCHDRQRLAVVEDLVVHPAHRRRGIGAALTALAVAHHLDAVPGSRIGIAVEPGSPPDHLARGLGFRPHATVWSAVGPTSATPGGRAPER